MPVLAGAAVGQPTVAGGASGIEVPTCAIDGELAEGFEDVSESEPHAESVKIRDVAPATSARVAGTREEFTPATLQPSVEPNSRRRSVTVDS